MAYKVFLVEDEIVTREGIRDNVDWHGAGFEFCGEAQDGEIALPLIERTQPDVLITDIKMPFMDGLQLCKIVRNKMPRVKIIVLSGHDEFEYAQSAIKLGVSEYLLKPISAAEIKDVLRNMAATLDRENEENAHLTELRNRVKDVVALKKEKLLLELAVGAVSPLAAIDEFGEIGLEMIAPHYLVILAKVNFPAGDGRLDPSTHGLIQEIVTELTAAYPGTLFTRKSVEMLLLIMMGDSPEQLRQDGRLLAARLQEDIQEKTGRRTTVGVGTAQQRLTGIHLSFVDALAIVNRPDQTRSDRATGPGAAGPAGALYVPHLDQAAVERYLGNGLIGEFDAFFARYLQRISEAAAHSTLIKQYLFVDVALTAAQFVAALGGDEMKAVPAIADIEWLLKSLHSREQIKEALRNLFAGAIAFRSEAQYERAEHIFQARDYVEAHFADPDLMLEDVAARVNLSPSHFSMVFGRETGESFKSYLTRIRIERAKELLRCTDLKCAVVAYQSGYNDPHYFSYAFKKCTGITPREYRRLARTA